MAIVDNDRSSRETNVCAVKFCLTWVGFFVAIAVFTGRAELLELAQPRALTVEECAKIYKAMAVLIRTNMALQAHANELEIMTTNLDQQLVGLNAMIGNIRNFAAFRQAHDDEDGS